MKKRLAVEFTREDHIETLKEFKANCIKRDIKLKQAILDYMRKFNRND